MSSKSARNPTQLSVLVAHHCWYHEWPLEPLDGMGTLNVTGYLVSTRRAKDRPSDIRFILGIRGDSADGPATNAIIYFFPTASADNVGYIAAGTQLIGLLRDEDFTFWYDILRNESPVKLSYIEGAGSGHTVPVDAIAIGTNDEPLGEGPIDTSP
jgi:hypothetical protein